MIKINTMSRTQEDEKSKAAALKASEERLQADLEMSKNKYKELDAIKEKFENDFNKVSEQFKSLNAEHHQTMGILTKEQNESEKLRRQI